MPITQEQNRGRFVWHELMTTDTAAAKNFYSKVIGWTTQKFPGGDPGIEYIMWMSGEAPAGGLMVLPKEAADMGAPPNWLSYIAVPDVDATAAQVQQLGGSVIAPPCDIPDVGRFAILRDPQGAVFAVIRGASEIPDETDPKPREFTWHELTTTDLDAGIAFYEKLFGWGKKSEFDMGDMGRYHMFGRDRFTYGGMMQRPPGMEMPPYWLHYIGVEHADAAAERATAAGGKVMLGPMEVPGGDRIAVITDPQGAWFAVHSKKPA